MQKLDGHWVAKRVGILEHYKDMSVSEIVLFDAYLLLANKQTWECWRTIRQLEAILPMKKDSIVRAKKKLAEKGWIHLISRSGIFIPKLYRYSEEKAADDPDLSRLGEQVSHPGERLSRLGEQTSPAPEPGLSHLGESLFPRTLHLSRLGERKVAFGGTIIEESSIIEEYPLLVGSEKTEISGLCKPDSQPPAPRDPATGNPDLPPAGNALPERPYLHLLKSIREYPFSFEKDLPFIRDLLVDFPSLDIGSEIKAWKTWLLDRKLTGKVNYRSRFRRWLMNSVRYTEEQRHGTKRRPGGERKAHGTTSSDAHGGARKGRKGFDLPSDYPIDSGWEPPGEDPGEAQGHGTE